MTGRDLGEKVASEDIGGDKVTIYSSGYAKIGVFGASKLKHISGKTDFHVSPTTVEGYDGFLGTPDVDVWEEGGTSYLTIVTDDWTETLTAQNPSKREMKKFWSVVTAGEAYCGASGESDLSNQSGGSLAGELEKLEELVTSGVISKSDYKKAKKRLIG